MKDEKGHGSDPRGAHAAGVQQVGRKSLGVIPVVIPPLPGHQPHCVDVHHNPSPADTAKLLQQSEYGNVRGILSGNDAYLWDASKSLHGEVGHELGLSPDRSESIPVNISKDKRLSIESSGNDITAERQNKATMGHPWIQRTFKSWNKSPSIYWS